MTATPASAALAWLLTYAIHSTVLLTLAWIVARARRPAPAAAELLWKSAMIGGIVTASLQLQLGVQPRGTLSLRSVPTVAAAQPAAPARAHETPVGIADEAATTVEPSVGGHDASSPAATAPTSVTSATSAVSREAAMVGAWALVAIVLAFAYAARRLILTGRIGDRHTMTSGPLFDMLATLSRDAGLRRAPRLTATPRISSPIALGVREICVPETALTALDVEQQRSMLAHELAHLARRDPVWMALASLVERVLWIQPLNRLARRQMATAAEYICDDWAVRRTGSGVALARCLAQVAEWIQASPLGVPVAGMAEERSLLVSRVARLLEGARPATRSTRVLAVGMIVVLLATVAFAPGVSLQSARASVVNRSHDWGILPKQGAVDPDTLHRKLGDQDVTDLTMWRTGYFPATYAGGYARKAPDDKHAMTAADSAVVLALIARLKDEDADVRAAAAHSLGRLEDTRAIPGLIEALRDTRPNVRSAAAEALGQFEDPRAIAPLVAVLGDANTEVKRNALEALTHYDAGVPVAGIARLLDDADADIRQKAAHLVGQLHDRSASAALAKLIHDPSADVRQASIEALGELHDQTAVTAIIGALSDANADVRDQALGTLNDLRAPLPDATLIALMQDAKPDVRSRAANIVGERSVIAAIPTLRRLLDDPNADVRQNAVGALGNIAHASAYEALRSALTSKDAKVRRAAAEALGERRE